MRSQSTPGATSCAWPLAGSSGYGYSSGGSAALTATSSRAAPSGAAFRYGIVRSHYFSDRSLSRMSPNVPASRPEAAAARRAGDERLYTISALAKEFALTPRAIRFYEDEGLIAPIRRGR